ncbi:MAG: ATP-dependent Clp protease ATP-binding subunit [Acidobacteria bacterium]|nr:ATP-dependent Clp protease ATP-binding subunit [Acidobacteriota bacterium]
MPTHFFPLTILTQEFEDDCFLSEALNFYEISRFHTNRESAVFNARLNAEQTIREAYANFLHWRLAPEEIEVREIAVEVAPPKKSEAWREPLRMKFHVVCAVREDGYCLGFVPAFKIEVLTKKAADFEEKIRREIVATLKRDGWTKSLQSLRRLERVTGLEIRREELAVTLPTARQRAIAEEAGEKDEKSVLAETSDDLRQIELKTAYETERQTAALAEYFRGRRKTSVLLVGASGVGKTALFHELVRRRDELGLKDHAFFATSGARLIAGQSGFGMWQERCRHLIDEAKKRDAILHLGNLIELVEVGKSEASSQGIGSFLRPKIARGELVAVVECTPEQLPVLERRDPQLVGAFQQFRLDEPDRKTSLRILERVAKEFAPPATAVDRQTETRAIKTIDAVHRRFSTYSAFPGRPVRFLRNLMSELEAGAPLAPDAVYKAFSNETGLPELLLNDGLALDLAKTEEFFAGRVIGQEEAVGLVAKMIATVKAKLTRPRRPIASLLFIGPTGVGKTELTKALAEFFFSDAGRLIRFDMSEFSNPLAVQRLIGGTGEKEGQLTAKVREQPFSVVLLDEFEKADQTFFDLLLQMLGEGRLTDAAGRVADFTNSIVVMTSNLGASEFQRGKSGFTRNARARGAAVRHFDAAVKNFLRPEIYNRIDRIVPFAPLGEETVRRIAALEIEKIRRRDGLRFRPVRLDAGADVLDSLAATGYDVRYGARPLKRTVERELLAPLAAELNRRATDERLTVAARLENERIALEFTAEQVSRKRSAAANLLAAQAQKIGHLRRRTQRFAASYRLTELNDELYRIARLEALDLRGKWLSDEDRERIKRKPKIQIFLDRAAEFAADVYRAEDEILLEIYGRAGETANHAAAIESREKLFDEFLFELLGFQYARPDELRLTLFGENAAAMFRLARFYLAHLKETGGEARRALFFTSEKQPEQKAEPRPLFDREVWRREEIVTPTTFAGAPPAVVGFVVEFEGPLARPRFGAESGIHRFVSGTRQDRVLTGSTDAEFDKFELPEELAKRDSVKFQPERRIYELSQNLVKELNLGKTYSLETAELADVVARALRENLRKTAENLIE